MHLRKEQATELREQTSAGIGYWMGYSPAAGGLASAPVNQEGGRSGVWRWARLCSGANGRYRGVTAAVLPSGETTSVLEEILQAWKRCDTFVVASCVIFVCSEHNKNRVQLAVNFVLRKNCFVLKKLF
jgi:hypothetical protein